MKKTLKYVLVIIMILLVMMLAIYLSLSVYYRKGFSFNTWINGVYCTGKSVNEVNEELLAQYEYGGFSVYDQTGKKHLITAQDIDLSYDYQDSLTLYLSRQNPYLWVDHLVSVSGGTRLMPVMSYDEDKLKACVEALPFFVEDAKKPVKELKIVKTQSGYVLINERVQVLNRDKAFKTIKTALENAETQVDLREQGCFEDLPLTAEMQKDLVLWEKIEAFQNCGILYQMGDELIVINGSVVCDWVTLDENGQIQFDDAGDLILREAGIDEFIYKLAGEYDTVGAARTFQATDGRTITVEGGIYGNKIDQKAEISYLKEAFLAKKEEVHIPTYTQQGRRQGKDDIGDTYIEVDMTNQMMYYYENGQLMIETEIVTGNTSRRMGTPEGVNYVYAKETNRVLRGQGYASPVKFWMPVKGNIGIHDASWRKEFGGEIYQTNGSHGCINTPYDQVKELFEMVEIGTPCVMFY